LGVWYQLLLALWEVEVPEQGLPLPMVRLGSINLNIGSWRFFLRTNGMDATSDASGELFLLDVSEVLTRED